MENKELINVFKMLTDDNRLKILKALCGRERNEKELVQELGIPQSTVSNHMGKLCQTGILNSRKEGRAVYYSISKDRVEEIHTVLNEFLIPFQEEVVVYTKGNPRGIVQLKKR